MPKLFDLSIKVEELALGRVMRLLHQTAGVAKVDFDLGDAPTAKPAKSNGASHEDKRKTRRFVDPTGATGADVLVKTLSKAKTPMKQAAIGAAFAASGRAAVSSASVLYALKNEGIVSNNGDGYVLTKKGRDKARYVK